jgi:hypothetical protein
VAAVSRFTVLARMALSKQERRQRENLNVTLAFLETRGELGPQKKPRKVLISLRVGRSISAVAHSTSTF